MRDDTILATIVAGRDDDNHFSVDRRQSAVPQHQGVMIGHKRPQFVWAMRQNQKNIRNKPYLFLYRKDHCPEVFG